MKLKEAIIKEAKEIKTTDLYPEELASLALYKILQYPYFKGEYDFCNLSKTNLNTFAIFHKELNNIKNLTNQRIDSHFIHFNGNESDEYDNLYSDRSLKVKKNILSKKKQYYVEQYTDIVSKSSNMKDCYEKIQEKIKEDPSFWINLNYITSNTYSHKYNLNKILMNIISTKEDTDLSEKMKRNMYFKENDIAKLDGMMVRDVFSVNLMKVYNLKKNEINEKILDENIGISSFLNKNIISDDLEGRFKELDTKEDKLNLLKEIKAIETAYKGSILESLLENEGTERYFNLFNQSFNKLKNDELKYLKENYDNKTSEMYLNQYQKEIESIEKKIVNLYPQLIQEKQSYNFTFESIGKHLDNARRDKEDAYLDLYKKEMVDLYSDFDNTFGVKKFTGLNIYDRFDNVERNMFINYADNGFEIVAFAQARKTKDYRGPEVLEIWSPCLIENTKDNLEIAKELMKPFFDYALKNELPISYYFNQYETKKDETSLTAFLDLKKEYNVIAVIDGRAHDDNKYSEKLNKNYYEIRDNVYKLIEDNQSKVSYFDLSKSIKNFEKYIEDNNIRIKDFEWNERDTKVLEIFDKVNSKKKSIKSKPM